MRQSRFTEAQIIMALRQEEGGTTIAEICRKLEITERTFHPWKKQFGGLGAWAYWSHVQLDLSRSGQPVDNTFIEAVNG